MLTYATVLGSFAFPTGCQIKLESKVLRLGFGGLLELDDNIVTVAVGQFGFTHERVLLLLELQFGFAAFGVRRQGHILGCSGNGLHLLIVEVDGHAAVFFHDHFGVRLGFFQQASALGRGEVLVVVLVGGGGSEQAEAERDGDGDGEGEVIYFHFGFDQGVGVEAESGSGPP